MLLPPFKGSVGFTLAGRDSWCLPLERKLGVCDRRNICNERIKLVSEPALLLPATAARTEYGAVSVVEARIASLTDVIRLPLGGICGA